MSRKYFGTDGIRGEVGEGAITPDFMLKLGWAAGRVLVDRFAGPNLILIGKDTRISGYMFESALQAGLINAGVDVGLLGPMPTPGIAYLTRTFQAQAGMIQWLSHPLEFGRPPDKLELIDESTLHWPPTGDRRRFWMFRYHYNQPNGELFSSIGLVGGETFSLRVPATMPIPEVYALHCCWELQVAKDPRAPDKLSAAHGAALLAEANPG